MGLFARKILYEKECDVIIVNNELLDALNPHKFDPLNYVRNFILCHRTYSEQRFFEHCLIDCVQDHEEWTYVRLGNPSDLQSESVQFRFVRWLFQLDPIEIILHKEKQ